MKHTVLFFSFFIGVLLFVSTSCQNSGAANSRNKETQKAMSDTANFTTLSLPDSAQNFGMVTRGKQVKLIFHIQNTGAKPLLIASAQPSCGCTVADFTKTPIAPGKSGEINASFDSNHGFPGHIRKTITVVTNTKDQSNTLLFTGEVKADSTKK